MMKQPLAVQRQKVLGLAGLGHGDSVTGWAGRVSRPPIQPPLDERPHVVLHRCPAAEQGRERGEDADVAQPGIQLAFHWSAPLGDLPGQVDGVLRPHGRVVLAGQQQHRRVGAVGVGDRLAERAVINRSEDRFQVGLGDRQEVERPGKRDHPRECGPVDALPGQIGAVERQHRRVVGAGRVPHHEHRRRVAADLAHMPQRPGHGRGVVLDESREGDLGGEPVVRHHHDRPALTERVTEELIDVLVAALPVAAVQEHHDRSRRGAPGPVHVQALARPGAVGDVGGALHPLGADQGVEHVGGAAASQQQRHGAEQEAAGHPRTTPSPPLCSHAMPTCITLS